MHSAPIKKDIKLSTFRSKGTPSFQVTYGFQKQQPQIWGAHNDNEGKDRLIKDNLNGFGTSYGHNLRKDAQHETLKSKGEENGNVKERTSSIRQNLRERISRVLVGKKEGTAGQCEMPTKKISFSDSSLKLNLKNSDGFSKDQFNDKTCTGTCRVPKITGVTTLSSSQNATTTRTGTGRAPKITGVTTLSSSQNATPTTSNGTSAPAVLTEVKGHSSKHDLKFEKYKYDNDLKFAQQRAAFEERIKLLEIQANEKAAVQQLQMKERIALKEIAMKERLVEMDMKERVTLKELELKERLELEKFKIQILANHGKLPEISVLNKNK